MLERTDDLDLSDDESLLRRVLDKPAEWFTIDDQGNVQVSSAAFKDGARELSVNVESQTTQEDVLAGHESDGLVSFLARTPRELGHIISKTLRDDDPPEPSHRVVCPLIDVGKKQYVRDAKAIADAAAWIVLPGSARP